MSEDFAVPPLLPHLPEPNSIIATIQRLDRELSIAIDTIVGTVDPTSASFETVIRPIATLKNVQSGSRSVIAALLYASPDIATQRAVEYAQSLSREAQADAEERPDYLRLIAAVEQRQEALEREDQKLLLLASQCHKKRRHGRINEEDITRLVEYERELAGICDQFNQNIRQHKARILEFKDEQLHGLPLETLAKFDLLDGSTRSVPVEKNTLSDVLTYVEVPDTRKQMALAWAGRLDMNKPLFKRAVQLRHHIAQIQGYSTFAESVLHDRVAGSLSWVYELLDYLAEKFVPAGREYLSRLECKKRGHLRDKDAKIEPWDVEFYAHKIDSENTIDQSKISEYFPLAYTFHALLRIFASYFQLRISQVARSEAEAHVWSHEVDIWRIWDERPGYKGEFIGHLYVDICGRPNKFKHNQAVNLQPSFLDLDGTRTFPIATIMCNLGDVEKHGCKLLKHRQIQTLFHELGHCMHDLLSRTKYHRFHGYWVKPEFGEAIGTMLEHWIWMPDVLKAISCHYSHVDRALERAWLEANPQLGLPPKRIPVSFLEELVKTRPQKRLNLHLQQLSETMFDLAVHDPSNEQFMENLDEAFLTSLHEDLQRRFMNIERPDLGTMHTSFNHLMSGMEAGYYAYLCANVFAEELFQEAFSNGRHANMECWNRFRRCILCPGGSKEELRMMKDFLGRDPKPDALLKSLSLLD